MAESSSSKTQPKKRRHSYSVSRLSHAPLPTSSTSSKKKGSRLGHRSLSEETSSQDISDERKRSKSFLGYFKSKTLRRNSAEASGSSVEKEAKSSPLASRTVFEQQDEIIRVVITSLDPQMNYKTLPISSSTTAHEVVATLVKKFALTLINHHTDSFYLTEVRESDQGSYSRLLEDDEKVHEIQKRWLNGRLCYFELCRKQLQPTCTVAPHDDFTDNGPIRAIVLSPSQDSSFSQECHSPISLSEFVFPPISNSNESQPTDNTATSVIHRIRDVRPPLSPSDNSEANSVDLYYTSPLTVTLDEPTITTSEDNNRQDIEMTHTSTTRRQSNNLVKAEPIASSTGTGTSSAKRDSLDQLVQQSVRQQAPEKDDGSIISSPISSPDKLPPLNGHALLDSHKSESGWILQSLVCSPVNPQGNKTLPKFIFTSNAETRKELEVAQHKTVTLIKHGPPYRQSKTSRLLSEVTFETCLTIYPKFQTTASLFPSFAHNMHYNTEMNISEPLATLLDSKINQGTRLKEKVQSTRNEKNGCHNQHITGGNHAPQMGSLESDNYWYSSSSVLHTSSLAQLATLPANIQTRRYTRRIGMPVARDLHRTYSKSTTCISSEMQSDLDAVISERRLNNQSSAESSKSLHVHSRSIPISLQPSQMQVSHTFSTTELFSNSFSTSDDIRPRVFSNPFPFEQQSQASKSSKSLQKVHQQRQQEQHERSSSEILLTFTNNQRPITVLLHSKSSTALDSCSQNNERSLSSTDLYDNSTLNTPQKHRDRPTSAPQHHRRRTCGNLAGLMDSLHQKADKKWWTEM